MSVVLAANPCFASKLPDNVKEYIKKELPKATIRFDSLIENADGTQYIPVIPLTVNKDVTELKPVFSIPKNQTLKNQPDIILLNNNYSFLKIIKKPNQPPTVIANDSIPLTVKLGLLPQDLLVPENLVLPADLRILLGNLVIPIKEKDDFINVSVFNDSPKNTTTKSTPANPQLVNLVNKVPELNNKMFFVINNRSNIIQAIPPEKAKSQYIIKLPFIPDSVVQTIDKRYLLVGSSQSTKVVIMDLYKNSVAKELELGVKPSSMSILNPTHEVYIASSEDSSVSIVNLDDMLLVRKIQLEGKPSMLKISYDNKSFIYLDDVSSKIYEYKWSEDLTENKNVAQLSNISDIYKTTDEILALNRVTGTLIFIDPVTGYQKSTVKVGSKPVDMVVLDNKIYILNAGSDDISVVDLKTKDLIGTITLNTGGFPRHLTLLESNTKLLVSNILNKTYTIVDINSQKVIEQIPIQAEVGFIVVAQKYGK